MSTTKEISDTEKNDLEKWREDFPFETISDEFVTRRDFLRFITILSGGLALGSGSIFLKSLQNIKENFSPIIIGKVNDIEIGSWRIFNFPNPETPAILVRAENGEFLAFHQKCPHLGCPVAYERSSKENPEQLVCHCHNGKFDLKNGKGISGPPRELRPLRLVLLKVENNLIWATGLADLHHRA